MGDILCKSFIGFGIAFVMDIFIFIFGRLFWSGREVDWILLIMLIVCIIGAILTELPEHAEKKVRIIKNDNMWLLHILIGAGAVWVQIMCYKLEYIENLAVAVILGLIIWGLTEMIYRPSLLSQWKQGIAISVVVISILNMSFIGICIVKSIFIVIILVFAGFVLGCQHYFSDL